MTSPTPTLRAFTDAAAAAVAREIATLRRSAQVEREARDEALRAMEQRLTLAEQRLAERIESVRDGEQGEPGERGEAGPPGEPGMLPLVRSWEDGVCYAGDVRAFEGATWQALRDTGKQPGHEDWILLSAAGHDGRDGTDGLSFRIRGTWIEINDYRALDVVALGGASFVARQDDPGPCPGDGWQLIAAQGKRGNPGPAGAKGERGPAGSPVIALSVSDEGLLRLDNGDGSFVTCDLYPVLSKVAR
jgi:hypothetical protein